MAQLSVFLSFTVRNRCQLGISNIGGMMHDVVYEVPVVSSYWWC